MLIRSRISGISHTNWALALSLALAGTAGCGTGRGTGPGETGAPVGAGGDASGVPGPVGNAGAPIVVGPQGGSPAGTGAASSTPVGNAGAPIVTQGGSGSVITEPGVPTTVTEEVPAELRQALLSAEATTASSIAETYPTPVPVTLAYDARAATGMDLIQASSVALSEAELAALAANGVVIAKSREFPSFAYGYKTIYADDLPVYVSADSILEAVHRSFDTLLKRLEEQVLIAELGTMITGMRARLPDAFTHPETTADADLYLSLASSVLTGVRVQPLIGENVEPLASLFNKATAGEGTATVSLFGSEREEDFSQFKPRGHYTDSETLTQYFKAMIWLGRVDLRLLETESDGSQTFHRRQFDAAVALRQLMGAEEQALWQHIDTTIGAFIGEHDSMTPKDLGDLMGVLGVSTLAESAALSDQAIIDAIAEGGFGAQRIASRIIYKDPGATDTLPLDRSFLLFGQRYTVDSHTFVNTTFDRVADRLMPNPLDAAFAALGNNSALSRLEPEFTNESYVKGLAKTRALVDAHESEYWTGSFYTRWLGALRHLSPTVDTELAGISRTAAWDSRILSTQLASWAELRHDTILYVKQSYTGGVTCEFPDAYVDPYPAFYAELAALANGVAVAVQSLPAGSEGATTWAARFALVMNNLEQMAQNQLTGTPHSQEMLDFINDAVNWEDEVVGCGGDVAHTNLAGWYLDLFLNEQAGLDYDPTVADVHTQPTDEAGNPVGRVLHVGTGRTRLMVVTAETCEGPRAYAGLAFSYGETITENYTRLNDAEWSGRIASSFPDVPWMSGVFGE